MASAQRRDGGAGATRHSPSSPGTRSRWRVKAIASAVRAWASRSTPSVSGWSSSSPATTSAVGRPGARRPQASSSRARSRSRSASARSSSRPRSTSRASPVPSSRSSGPGRAPPRGGPRRRPPPGGRPAACGRRSTTGSASVAACGQALGRAQEGLGHRGGDPVEGGHGGVDRVGPGGQVAAAGLGPLVREGVLAVVAGHVQGGDVVQRVGPVQLQLAQLQPGSRSKAARWASSCNPSPDRPGHPLGVPRAPWPGTC